MSIPMELEGTMYSEDGVTQAELERILEDERASLSSMYGEDRTGDISPGDKQAYYKLAFELMYAEVAIQSILPGGRCRPSAVFGDAKKQADEAGIGSLGLLR
jgi:hypothetical protein